MALDSDREKQECQQKDYNPQKGLGQSIRQSVFSLLDKNPNFKPKKICRILGLVYAEKGQYVSNLKSDWKSNRKSEQHLKCSESASRSITQTIENIGYIFV